MDTFTWSLPFVAEKVTEMFYHMLKNTKDDDIDDEDLEEIDINALTAEEKGAKIEEKKEILRNKVKFVSKMLKM